MAVYTVHARSHEPDAIRDAVFVREGFSRAAFVFGPLWLLRFRLWIAALVWILVAIALVAVSTVLTATAGLGLFILFAILTGLEANGARRRGLARRGHAICDVVAPADRDTAERRFFDRVAANGPPALSAPRQTGPAPRPVGSPVLGLFPEAEGRP